MSYSSHAYEELRLTAATLFSGEQRGGEICPFCRGGRSGERTLSLSRLQSGAVVYICHRAQCARKGRIEGGGAASWGSHEAPSSAPKEFTPREFRGFVEEVPDVIAEYYIAKYGFTEKEFRESRCGWSPDHQRTAWQVLSPVGAVRGWELRSHRNEDRPKTLHYRHSPDPWVGFHLGSGGGIRSGLRQVVAVEDLLSAYKVSRSYPAASIMGSHLSLDIVMDLMRVSETIVLCLDKDATQKAISFVKRFMFICPGLVCVPIERDLKYETHENIQRIIGEALP